MKNIFRKILFLSKSKNVPEKYYFAFAQVASLGVPPTPFYPMNTSYDQ